ncbi:3-hydroxyacyl-CoA dehydrogenase NAD-binding domain-containing protein [Parazoarcus communis]|uniref:3-hydroxyacyl-CoA dehydrogenase n=1 Tax=Parazoarcus communis SWub3 = DSM 12120 TaxID=1121029 RepID=A0A323V3I1_9RHOO|nr:3-hydroxyacyl-CoA dehydrogenase NAD-binding domain-containing protein [Parazoarcus communis]NMG69681.1 3-hydroxyacyl-CoA dehydrogenase [Parazoarcus communis SWub3 = DSM 12120]PZA17986.1 3-hydroxyacyl-CoA dehydrogenase [Azoarcus communis] [Parazoarcus communis SWub3 = DSM 12120]
MTEVIHISVDADGIATLLFDRTDSNMNTMDMKFMDEIAAAIERLATDDSIKGAIFTSGKPVFAAGADLKEMEASLDKVDDTPVAERLRMNASLSKLLRRMETCGKPVACAINGTALGGGTEIALACHYRVVSDARGIQLGLPEVQVGLLPGGGGTQRVSRLVGIQAAMPVVMEGQALSAEKALKMGLVHKVVPADQLLAEAKRWLVEEGDPVQPWDKKGFRIPGGAGPSSPAVAQMLVVSNAMLQARTFHNLPAPKAILSCLYEGPQLPMDKALDVEAKYFTLLQLDPVSRNMIRTLFINKGKADKLMHRPEGVPKTTFRKIGVVGAGLMGAGIAYHCAKLGIETVLIDRDQAAADKGKAYSAKRLEKDIAKGRMTQDKADAILARIHPTTDYAGLADVELVVEAVFEDRGIKAEITRKLDAVLPAHAVISSNTSALPISELAEAGAHPENFIGMHFFSPVERMPLVEIIRGRKTSPETLARALDLVQAMKKTPIVVNDGPGFFTSRFIGAYINESLAMVTEGVNPALIENAAKMAGIPVGPLTVSDEIGLDTAWHASQQRKKDEGDAFKPTPTFRLVEKLVGELGRHGRKNGKGFFEYAADGSKKLWPGLAELFPPLAEQPTVDEVKARMLYAQLVDAAKAMAEGVLIDPADGDVGSILGVGFPAYLGGPFSMMDTIGIDKVVAECDRLAAHYGAQYAAPQLLRDMAAEGRTFYGARRITPPAAVR